MAARRAGRPGVGSIEVRWPDDDRVWSLRGMTWVDWAEEIGVAPRTLSEVMGARGWSRGDGDNPWGLLRAPCRVCGASYDVDRYPLRECKGCRLDTDVVREKLESGQELTLREERVLNLERKALGS